MEHVESVRLIAKAITMTIAQAGAAFAQGWIIAKAMEAMGRNPDAAATIFPKMIIGAALAESTAIYAFVAFFML